MRQNESRELPSVAWRWLLAIAGAQFLVQMLTAGHYGIFRDEFYYLACADRLAWGYVDQPPFSIAALAAWTGVFGDSVHAIRLPAALVGGTNVVMTGLIARGMGGGRFAQILAALVAALAPAYLAIGGFYSMNVFAVALWTASFLTLVHIVRGGDRRLWLVLGVLLGVGLMNKIGVLVLGVGIAGGLLLTSQRRWLRSGYPWAAAGIALLLFLPHVIWQVVHGWPTLEFIANAKAYKIAAYTPLGFFREQLMLMHPLYALLWLAGLGFLFFSKRMRAYRFFGWIFVIVFAVLVMQRSKPYYLVAAYAPLIAAGAIAFEQLTRERVRWLRGVVAAVVIVTGIALAPMAIPVLSPAALARYQAAIGIAPSSGENDDLGELPQIFADRFGWEELAQTVSSVYLSLPESERDASVVVTGNYGEAGALEYFSDRYPLPRVASQHNNYFFWGLGELTPEVVITVGIDGDGLEQAFETVEAAAVHDAEWARPGERRLTIYVCRGFKIPPETAWAAGKHFI